MENLDEVGMNMILQKNVTIASTIFWVMTLMMIGCNQNQGALPSEDPPSFDSWQLGKQNAQIQTYSNQMELEASTNIAGNVQSNDESKLIDMTNAERQRTGLLPLKVNPELMNQARIKAQDMVSNNYFSHDSPTFGSPFDQIRSANIPFGSAGENIAGNRSASDAFQAWMNSSGHRSNILNKDYNQIGVGVVEGGPYGKMLVQMFIRQ